MEELEASYSTRLARSQLLQGLPSERFLARRHNSSAATATLPTAAVASAGAAEPPTAAVAAIGAAIQLQR